MPDRLDRRATLSRRWGFCAILAGLLLASANELALNQPLYRKAALIHIGQSEDEVRATLGQPNTWTSKPGSSAIDGYYYGPVQRWWDWQIVYPIDRWLSKSGLSFPAFCRPEHYPVVISFGTDHRVSRVRYGKTVIDR